MRKIYLSLLLLAAFTAGAQNPLIVKTVSSTTLEPESDAQLNKRVKPWNGKVFYMGKGATGHTILAVTDGSTAGTQVVSDLGDVGTINGVYPAQDFVYITATKIAFASLSPITYAIDTRLYRSDGTAAGTTLLKQFPTTASISQTGVFYSDALASVNYSISGNTIYFAGYDPASGMELWKSDGTAAGTAMVKDINPGTQSGVTAGGFCKVGNTVCFFATDGVNSYQLWKTDGTAAGTSILTRINSSAQSIAEFYSGLYKGKMYFWANDGNSGSEVWYTDGTAAGTQLLKETIAGNNALTGTGGMRTDLMFIQDDRYLYFPVERSKYVWRTDGTAAGTVQLNTTPLTSQNIAGATARGNRIYWLDNTTTLYVSNGTEAGTRRVADNLSQAGQLFSYKGAAWFQARPTGLLFDAEPWRSDGTAANTARALDVSPGSGSSDANSYFELNGYLYFFATNGTGKHLFRYNGDMTFNGSLATGRWRDSANWNSAMPPGATDTAYIPAGLTANVTGANASAGTLVIQTGGGINLAAATDSLFIHQSISGGAATGPGVTVLRSALADTVRVSGAFTGGNLFASGQVALQARLTAGGNLALAAGTRIRANNSDLVLSGAAATLSGAGADAYVVTNGTGALVIEELGPGGRTGAVSFPVGTEAFYNPVSIANSGTRDAFRARVRPGVNQAYSGETPTGADYIGNTINVTWMIGEGNPGGSDATLGFQWNAAQELPGFNRAQSQVGHYLSGAWQPGATGAATGSDPYTRQSGSVTSFSPFSVFSGAGVLGGTALPSLVQAPNGIRIRQSGNALSVDLGKTYPQARAQVYGSGGELLGRYDFRQQQLHLHLPATAGIYLLVITDGSKVLYTGRFFNR